MAEDIFRQIRKENSNSDMDSTAHIYNKALIMVEDLCLAITRSARDAVSRTAIENRRANYHVAKYQPATAVHLEMDNAFISQRQMCNK
jgi:riboflavin synthase alpha subunit